MEIRIALNNSPDASEGDTSDDHRCGYLPTRFVEMLSLMNNAMPNRDATIVEAGTRFLSHIEKWYLDTNPINERLELVIEIDS